MVGWAGRRRGRHEQVAHLASWYKLVHQVAPAVRLAASRVRGAGAVERPRGCDMVAGENWYGSAGTCTQPAR